MDLKSWVPIVLDTIQTYTKACSLLQGTKAGVRYQTDFIVPTDMHEFKQMQ